MRRSLLRHTVVAAVAWCLALAPLVPGMALASESELRADLARQESMGNTGFQEDDSLAPSVHEGDNRKQSRSSLPATYDSRGLGYVTGARDQGPFGTCWVFATLGVIESSMLRSGLASDPSALDLSERHLTYFSWHTAPDPLGNTAGDYNTPFGSSFVNSSASDPYLGTGGNYALSGHALESWMGVANEDALPTYAEMVSAYRLTGAMDNEFVDGVALDQSLSHSLNAAHVSGIYRISMADQDDIKQAIVDHGAVGVTLKFNNGCFNTTNNAFYNASPSSSTDFGHTVTIIGWDDDFERTKFYDSELKRSAEPPADGAWIAKNSWGKNWGDNGFFYISYYDGALQDSTAKAYTYEVDDVSLLDNIYQYDGTSGTCYNTVRSGGSIANVFHATANPDGSEELRTVSFSLASVNVSYSVQVYTDVRTEDDPTSGDAALATPVAGTTSYAGYYTVDLPEPVSIAEGSYFSVVVTFEAVTGSDVKYEVDTTYGYGESTRSYGNTWAHYTNHAEPFQSFERDTASSGWDDLCTNEYDSGDEPYCSARLKAFTTNAETQVEAKPVWRRLAGHTALDTMQAILETDGVFTAQTVDTVILASSDDYRDALSATALAGCFGAPVLITPQGYLAPKTRAELQRLQPSRVILAGGEVALTPVVMSQVRDALPNAESFVRASGQTGVLTSVNLYQKGSGWSTTAIVATSNSYKDALSIAPYAYAKKAPIFLANLHVDSSKRDLCKEVLDALVSGGFSRVIIVGGNLAVSTSVEGQLEGIGIRDHLRIAGGTALDTSAAIAAFELGEGMTLQHMAVATTSSYKDALTGAALAGAQESVLVLADVQGGYTAFDAAFQLGGETLRHGHILGGDLAISQDSEAYIRALTV